MSAPESARVLTDGQRRIVGFAAGLFALTATIVLLVYAFGKLTQLLGHFSGVLWPLAVAGVMALILRPVVEAVARRLHGRRLAAVIVLYGLFVLVLTGVAMLITPPLVEQVFDFIAYVPTFWERALSYVQQHYPQWVAVAERQLANPTVKRIVDGLLAEAQALLGQTLPTLMSAGAGALNVFTFATHAAVVPIYLFFFLLSSAEPTRNLPAQLTFLRPSVRDDVVFLVREFIAIIVSFFRGQLLIALLMGALLAVGFTVVGLRFGLFIGLTLGVLNIVPYLGTIIGLSVALPLAFLQPDGGWQLVALVLLVFIIVQNIEGWYLTPKIMSDRTGLHPVAIIVAIFFWGTAFNGIIGMVLAIPLTAFFVTTWRLAKKKYLRPPSP